MEENIKYLIWFKTQMTLICTWSLTGVDWNNLKSIFLEFSILPSSYSMSKISRYRLWRWMVNIVWLIIKVSFQIKFKSKGFKVIVQLNSNFYYSRYYFVACEPKVCFVEVTPQSKCISFTKKWRLVCKKEENAWILLSVPMNEILCKIMELTNNRW